MEDLSLTTPQAAPEEVPFDTGLRPQTLADYIGQDTIKDTLKVFIEASKGRSDAMEHVLLSGPPGLGKTTLAHIIAHERGVGIRVTSGPAIERAGDLAAILTNLSEGDVLFIDEIHRINKSIVEALYPAMEDCALDIVLGKGPSARTIRLDLPHFTLIGATTRMSLLAAPLRDRFGSQFHLSFYEDADIEKILHRSAGILGVELHPEAAGIVASRSRATPRIANRLLKRVRDFAQVKSDGIVTVPVAKEALAALGIDEHGLDQLDRRILETIIEKFKGGPVGVGTIAAALSEETETIEEVYEPFLMQKGFLQRTSRGRMATSRAYEHLGFDAPASV